MGARVGVERDQRRSKEAEGTPWTLVVAMRELKMWILTWTCRPASCQTQWPKEELTIHPRSIENLKREEEKKQGHRERRRGIARNSWNMRMKSVCKTHFPWQPIMETIQSITNSIVVVTMVSLDSTKEEEKRGRSTIVVETDPRRISGPAPKIMSRPPSVMREGKLRLRLPSVPIIHKRRKNKES